jgi:hypothetical protein
MRNEMTSEQIKALRTRTLEHRIEVNKYKTTSIEISPVTDSYAYSTMGTVLVAACILAVLAVPAWTIISITYNTLMVVESTIIIPTLLLGALVYYTNKLGKKK